jgi:hypothetical protein
VVVLGELAGTLLAFLLSSTSPAIEVRTSATRLFEQFLPLALFAGALGLSKVHLYNRPLGDENSARREDHGRRRAGAHRGRPSA